MFNAAIFRPTSMTNTTSTGRSGVAASWVPSRRPKAGQKRSSLRKKLLKGCLKFCLSISILLVFEVKSYRADFVVPCFFFFQKKKHLVVERVNWKTIYLSSFTILKLLISDAWFKQAYLWPRSPSTLPDSFTSLPKFFYFVERAWSFWRALEYGVCA